VERRHGHPPLSPGSSACVIGRRCDCIPGAMGPGTSCRRGTGRLNLGPGQALNTLSRQPMQDFSSTPHPTSSAPSPHQDVPIAGTASVCLLPARTRCPPLRGCVRRCSLSLSASRQDAVSTTTRLRAQVQPQSPCHPPGRGVHHYAAACAGAASVSLPPARTRWSTTHSQRTQAELQLAVALSDHP